MWSTRVGRRGQSKARDGQCIVRRVAEFRLGTSRFDLQRRALSSVEQQDNSRRSAAAVSAAAAAMSCGRYVGRYVGLTSSARSE